MTKDVAAEQMQFGSQGSYYQIYETDAGRNVGYVIVRGHSWTCLTSALEECPLEISWIQAVLTFQDEDGVNAFLAET